jgi:hypothetical protein
MLRRALEEERLRVHYQPIIDLRSGRVASVEALIRIFDPEMGMQEPASFLEVAEATGLLYVMDEWVFANAMREAAGWHARLGERNWRWWPRGSRPVASSNPSPPWAATGPRASCWPIPMSLRRWSS